MKRNLQTDSLVQEPLELSMAAMFTSLSSKIHLYLRINMTYTVAAILNAMLYNNEKIPNNESEVRVMRAGNGKQ